MLSLFNALNFSTLLLAHGPLTHLPSLEESEDCASAETTALVVVVAGWSESAAGPSGWSWRHTHYSLSLLLTHALPLSLSHLQHAAAVPSLPAGLLAASCRRAVPAAPVLLTAPRVVPALLLRLPVFRDGDAVEAVEVAVDGVLQVQHSKVTNTVKDLHIQKIKFCKFAIL